MRKTILPLLMLAALLATESRGQQSNQFEVDLQEAIRKETVEGDLNGAIEQYEEIAESSDRVIAAKALIRLAGCYEKLGVAESRKIYERVIRDYADQQEAVQVARARLRDSESAVLGKGDRVVWAGENVEASGRVSPDGRFLSYTDWNITGNLMLHDLVTGTNRPLTGNNDLRGPGRAGTSVFSPDGKQVAFGWMNREPRRFEIRIIDLGRTGIPEAKRVYESEERSLWPYDWSSDGTWLAVHLAREDNNGQIGLVSVKDGSLRVLKSIGWRVPGRIFFSPDSRYIAYDLSASDTESLPDVFILAVDGSSETRAIEHPTNDSIMGWSPDGRFLLLASNRAGAMGLWAVPVSNGIPQGEPTLLKPDIGSVYSLGLTTSGALYLTKDASTERLQIAPIDLTSGRLTGASVVQSYRSRRPDWSPDGDYLAYRSEGKDGIPVVSIRSIASGDAWELRPRLSFFLRPRWMPDGQSLMAWGREPKGREGIFRIDARTGATSFVKASCITDVQVSPDGKRIYCRDPLKRGRVLELDLVSSKTTVVFETDRPSGIELSPDGHYLATVKRDPDPDVSSIVLISVANGEEKELLRVTSPEIFISYGCMSWTPNSEAVLAVKTKRSSGDPHGRQGPKEVWFVPVNHGKARKLDTDIDTWKLNGNQGIRLHPDGNQIAFFTGKKSREVWALEGLLPSQSAGN